MNDEQLRSAMDSIATKAVPDGSSVWDKIEASYKAESKVKRMPQRWNWAAVFIAVLAASLLSTGGALAYILLRDFPGNDAGGENVANAGLGVELNETATVNGVTINLIQGYADSERILLFYTLEGIDPTRFNHREPDAELVEIYNFGGIDLYQTYDGLHYQYRLSENRVLLLSSFPHDATGDTVDFFWQVIINNLGEVAPPEFHFNLSLPIQESLLVPVNQTIDVEGFAVTLESIELSAASTTVRICSVLPDAFDHIDFNDLGLLIDGELYVYVYGSEQNSSEGQYHCMEQSFNAGILTGSETIEVTFSGFMVAPVPTEQDIEDALARLEAEGFEAEINLVNGHIEWEILSYPEGYNAEVWLYSSLYDYRQLSFDYTFNINLGDIVLNNR